jgi:imidazolonepropionase-like amidohydrolase
MKRLALCFGLMLVFAGLFAQTEKGTIHIKNGTVITITDGIKENTDVLVVDGVITRIGKNLRTPNGARAVDATGQYVMPGIIDAHSHIALDAVNESTNVSTAEVRTGDVLNPLDVSIYRALAGGVTASHAMHGSANAIGGQCETIKHRYGTFNPDDLKMVGAPRTIKFALGENPMRVHGEGNRIIPRTRMGVEQIFRQEFSKGQAYMEAWDNYEKKKDTDATAVPPKYDRRLETMADILKGDIIIHCHSYRADEILMLMNVCRDFGVKRLVFQHVNEGFKVAPELAEFGAGASVFADWWAYKFEVYYSTAYNAAILAKNGVVTSINSDSGDYIRHLFHQAGKSQRYGGLSDNEALRLITLNPAIQLGIDDRVGSLEKGKDGDIAIFRAHPLSIYAVPQMTIVDGVVEFDINEDADDMRLDVNPETTDNMWLDYDLDHRCMEGVNAFFGFQFFQKR